MADPLQLDGSMVRDVLAKSSRDYWKKMESERIRIAGNIWAWYSNDVPAIKDLIRGDLINKIFRPRTLRRMNIRVLNIVPRVCSRLSKVYRRPAVRQLNGGTQYEATPGGDVASKQDKNDQRYQDALKTSNIDARVKEAERQVAAFNTVLVQPVWRVDDTKPDGGYLDFIVHNPAFTTVTPKPAHYLTPSAFYYPVYVDIEGVDTLVYVYWSATDHYYVTADGARVTVPTMTSQKNPYGILPAAVLRVKEGSDFWGEPAQDLTDGNQEACIQATNLFYTAIFQSHGQAVGKNMGTGDPEIGPDKPIMLTSSAGTAESSFDFAHPSPMINEARELVDWLVKAVQATRGLVGGAVSLDPNEASGVSKVQDAIELAESREDMLPAFTQFERDLFLVTRAVWNYHNPSSKISDDAEFDVSFAVPEITKTADEQINERKAGLEMSTLSRVDIIMQDNPGMSREQATDYLKRVIAENRKVKDEFGLFDDVDDAAGDDAGDPSAPPASRQRNGLPINDPTLSPQRR